MPFKGQKHCLEFCFRNYYRYIQLKTMLGPRTLLRKTDANLDCVFVETKLIFIDPKIGGGGSCPPLLGYVREPCETHTYLLGLSGQSRGNALFQIHWTQVIYFDCCCHRFTDMQTLLPTKILGWQVCTTYQTFHCTKARLDRTNVSKCTSILVSFSS